MVPDYIQKLINAHRKDKERITFLKSLRHISVSKVASFAGGTYERIRNTVELEQEHLLRRRAIRRIMIRMGVFKGGNPTELGEDLLREIIWAKYMKNIPVPEIGVEEIGRIIGKYQNLVISFKTKTGSKLDRRYAEDLYDIASFEIERAIIPYNEKDALANLQYYLMSPLKLAKAQDLPEKFENVQTYVNVLRSLTKCDNPMIKFYMFNNAFPFWNNPSKSDYDTIISRLEKTLIDINAQLEYKLSNKIFKEFIRQSISVKILNQLINENLDNAEDILQDKAKRDEHIMMICEREYSQSGGRVRSNIIKMMLYLAITKMFFAIGLEVPYELWILREEHLNYIPLAINVFFPPVLMAIVASSFRIPKAKNTQAISEMIDRIMDPAMLSYQNRGLLRVRRHTFLHMIFEVFYYIVFFAVLAATTYSLKEFLHYNLLGIGIFVVFICLISFGALKVRNTATELIVVPTPSSIFTPLIDVVAVPVVAVGKRLSESVSKFSPIPFFFDYIIESPYKAFIWIFEEWNTYMRERREEIV